MRSNASLEGVVLEGSPAARNPNDNLYKNPKLYSCSLNKYFARGREKHHRNIFR